jgi:tetratricopeptide (TPR) repeat protein
LASVYLEVGDSRQAALEFRKALLVRPFDAHAHFELGLCLEKIGNTEGAMEQLDMIGRAQTDFREAQEHLKYLRRKDKTN